MNYKIVTWTTFSHTIREIVEGINNRSKIGHTHPISDLTIVPGDDTTIFNNWILNSVLPSMATQLEAEEGIVTASRQWSPQLIVQAIRGSKLVGLDTSGSSAIINSSDNIITAFGKLQKQISDILIDLISHRNNKSNPHDVKATQIYLTNVDISSSSMNISASDTVLGAFGKLQKQIIDHRNNMSNPHNVTIGQLGGALLTHTHNASDIVAGRLSLLRLPTSNLENVVLQVLSATTDPVYSKIDLSSNVVIGALPRIRGGWGSEVLHGVVISNGLYPLTSVPLQNYSGNHTFLRNDGVWSRIYPADIDAAHSSHVGTRGPTQHLLGNGTPGFSSYDYSWTEKGKLETIEHYAQVNKIESINMNGVSFTITNKAVNIDHIHDFSTLIGDELDILLASLRLPRWLTMNTNFYVNGATGSDSYVVTDINKGKSPSTAFKTIHACCNYVSENYNMGVHSAIINVANGTYNVHNNGRMLVLPKYNASTGNIIIKGASKNGTIILGSVVSQLSSFWYLDTLTVKWDGLAMIAGIPWCNVIHIESVSFTLTNVHIDMTANDQVTLQIKDIIGVVMGDCNIFSNCSMSGNATFFMHISSSGRCALGNDLVLNGEVTEGTILCANNSTFLITSDNNGGVLPVITGTVIGRRYVGNTYSVISVGGGQNFFPGTIPGILSNAIYA